MNQPDAMLQNELKLLAHWAASREYPREAAGGPACAVQAECARVQEAWSQAAFSSASNETLQRYFDRHLKVLADLLNTTAEVDDCLAGNLTRLIGHLWQYFAPYLDAGSTAPQAYALRHMPDFAAALALRSCLASSSSTPPQLKDCLLRFLDDMPPPSAAVRYSFHMLHYFQRWVRALSELDLDAARSGQALHEALEELNFNHLGYFRYLKDTLNDPALTLTEKLLHFQAERSKLVTLPGTSPAYHPQWPATGVLLSGWLGDEITVLQAAQNATATPVAEKIPLNLSVAHLACLLNLCCETDLTHKTNLAELFRFISRHFSTRRQPDISPGSLSKEYYSTTQVTAANVQGMLQQMVSRINQRFFPVWAVVNVMICALLAN